MGGQEVVGETGTWWREHPHCSGTSVPGERERGGRGEIHTQKGKDLSTR